VKKNIKPIFIALFLISASAITVAAADLEPQQKQLVSEIGSLGSGSISGVITNSDGVPQENAHVVVFAFGLIGGPAVSLSSTGSDGSYSCPVPVGRYNVIAFKFGEGVAYAAPILVESGKTTGLDLSLTGGLFPGATSVSQSIYESLDIQKTVTRTRNIQSIASQQNSLMSPLSTGYISGVITNSDGVPQENAHVVVFAFGLIGGPAVSLSSTGSDGSYSCPVPVGRYNVIAFKFGEGVAYAAPILVESDKTTDLDLSLTGGLFPGATPVSQSIYESSEVQKTTEPIKTPVATPTLTSGTGTITGTVTNQNGNPVAFVRVIAVANPNDPNASTLGVAFTHLLIGGKGEYTMRVQAGQYLFLRAAKLPFYIGAWAGPIYVGSGETVNLDLSITFLLNNAPAVNQMQYAQSAKVSQQSSPAST
jgi:uncharacterized protein YodC (DUF2158 family)